MPENVLYYGDNHDIRRTFATIADDTVSPSQIKNLLNHSTKNSDVTAGDIILSREKKIEAEQRMADAIDRLLTPPAERNVVPFSASKKARKGGKALRLTAHSGESNLPDD